MDESWNYEHSIQAYGLRLVFGEDTETESKYDTITITDSDGNETEYDGDELSGGTVILRGSTFTISLSTDSSVTRYGFSFTEITGLTQAEYEAESSPIPRSRIAARSPRSTFPRASPASGFMRSSARTSRRSRSRQA